jgi:hypothetical protein
MTLPTLYAARSDVRAEDLPRVEKWYADRHAPDLLGAGFYSSHVYYSEVGSPLICNLYEIPGAALFDTDAYRAVAARDVEGPAVIALMTNRSNTIYAQVLTAGVPAPARSWATGDRTGALGAPCIATVRFEAPAGAEGRLLEWYRAEELPRQAARPGFRAARVCRRDGRHPTAPTRDPGWFVITEWDRVDAGRAALEALGDQARLARGAGAPVTAFQVNLGRLRMRFLGSDGP